MITLLKKILNYKNFSFISELLFLAFSFISIILYNSSAITPWFYVSLLLSIFFLVLSSYNALYSYLDIPKSASSFIFFLINNLILISYMYGIYILIIKGIPKPIYIENLSILSQYRYLFLCVIVLCYLFLYTTSKVSIALKKTLTFFMFPHLKEEFRKILYLWNSSIFGDFCSFIINNLYQNKYFRILFFCLHFTSFVFFRLILLLLFIKFIFFNGDLRLILYCIPISFIIWLLSFIDYYFNVFFTETCNAIESFLIINKIDNNFSFTLTETAIKEGFTRIDILAKQYIKLLNISNMLIFYKQNTQIISYLILFVQTFLWFYVTYIFFSSFYLNTVLSVGTPLSNATMSRMCIRLYAKEIYFLRKEYSKELATETNGVQKDSFHFAVIDTAIPNPDHPGEVRYYGSCTTGRGPYTIPSHTISLTEKANGTPGSQYFIPTNTVQYYPRYYFSKLPVPGSSGYCAKYKYNFDKAIPEEEST